LIIGKPRSGKTSAAAGLSEKLDLVHITVDRYLKDLMKKISEYEPPEDLEEDQEPPKWLSDFEEEIKTALTEGQDLTILQITKILCDQVKSDAAQTKGYVLDLPYFTKKEAWAESIKNGELGVLPSEISYIVELDSSDEDIKKRAENMRLDLETGEIVSLWEREQRKVKKEKTGEGEGEEDEEEEEEELDEDGNPIPKPKIFDEQLIVKRPNESEQQISEELASYSSVERPAFDELLKELYHF